jgi:hypothetical protein
MPPSIAQSFKKKRDLIGNVINYTTEVEIYNMPHVNLFL